MQAAVTQPAALLQRVQQAYRATQVPEYRACQLCRHHGAGAAAVEGGLCLRDALRPVPVPVARSRQGGCGPNAEHMDVPGWALQG